MAALWCLIGTDVMSSCACQHIARLLWRHSAACIIILAAVVAGCAWLCAFSQQFAGVFAVSHGLVLGVVWGIAGERLPTRPAEVNGSAAGRAFSVAFEGAPRANIGCSVAALRPAHPRASLEIRSGNATRRQATLASILS